MKRNLKLLILGITVISALNVQAQESSWTTGADFVSSYVWRGTKFGSGPAIQPSVEFSTGGLAIGAWGNYNFTDDEVAGDAGEADLYASYSFDLSEESSLSITLTDYYFPGTEYFKGESHYFEPMVGLSLSSFSLTAAYMINKAGDNDVSDLYLEAGLSAGPVNLFVGAGDGQYSTDGDFDLCNIGVSTSKEIKISDSFSLPVFGSAILNPSSEQFHIVVGFSL